ncbi:MAG TPA: sensor histidine kinase [Anaerolineae bacterium]|nr:sensor histidine kinase [Anaerolineae bacterium]
MEILKIKRVPFTFNRSIQVDMMLAFLLIALLPVTLVNQFYYDTTRSFIEERVKSYDRELIHQRAKQLDTLLSQIQIIKKETAAYLVGPDVLGYFSSDVPADKVFITTKTENYLRNLRRSFPPSIQIYIILSNGTLYSTNGSVNRELLTAKEWIATQPTGNSEKIIPPHPADYFDLGPTNPSPHVVSFVSPVFLHDHADTRALIQIDLNYADIQNIFQDADVDKEGEVYVQDFADALIYTNSPQFNDESVSNAGAVSSNVDSLPKRNGDYLITAPIESAGWQVTGAVSEQNLNRELSAANQTWITITIIAALFAIVTSYVLSSRINRPIRELVKSMKKAGAGVFDTVSFQSRNTEIQVLCSSFNSMVNQIETLMKHVVEKETETTHAQLRALEAQINPHFLYNTLETMRSIAVEHQIGSIAQICKGLADMFRYSISKSDELVTLRDEIRHVQNYMMIQSQRFGDKIRFECLIDNELLDCKTIKLILQPLIENSVFHGLEMKRGSGRILVSAYEEDGNISINVVDNGVGIEPAQAQRLNSIFQGTANKDGAAIGTRTGIGLVNVNSRIKLYYGKQYGLSIFRTPNCETLVRVTIPLVLNPESASSHCEPSLRPM